MDFPAHLILTCNRPELSAEASVCDYSEINTTLIVFRIAGFVPTRAMHVRICRDVADSCHVAFLQHLRMSTGVAHLHAQLTRELSTSFRMRDSS